MREDMIFTAYSVLKNEDAIPYAEEGLLAVADGLGGAGSTVHVIDREAHPSFEKELYEAAFLGFAPEYLEERRELISAELEPMLDLDADTSALWASRIALLRFVYGVGAGYLELPSDPDSRARLSSFVGDGLRSVASRFGFEKGKYGGQVVMPTTLASLKYKKQGAEVLIDALWAGDSRCYLLCGDGIKQLTADDEDGSGAITNLFYADPSDATLNHRSYKVKSPCLLVALSDGAFDPYEPNDNLGVEYSLLSVMSGCDSIEEYSKALTEYYDGLHSDDASLAFAAIGYEDFSDMKASFAERAAATEALFSALHRLAPTLKAMEKSEDEATGYIYTRTGDKFEAVSEALCTAAVSGSVDVAISGEVLTALEDAKRRVLEQDGEKSGIGGAAALKEKLLEGYGSLRTVICQSALARDKGGKYDALGDLKHSAESLRAALEALKSAEYEAKVLQEKGIKVRARVLDIIAECEERWKKTMLGDDMLTSLKEQREILKREHLWKNVLICLAEKTICQRFSGMSREDKRALYEINQYITRCIYLEKGVLEMAKRRCKSAFVQYERTVELFISLVKKNDGLAKELLLPEAAKLLEEEGKVPIDPEKLSAVLRTLLSERRELIIPSVVTALAARPDDTSVIDVYYNKTRLNFFREFYRLKNNPSATAAELAAELSDYNKSSLALITERENA